MIAPSLSSYPICESSLICELSEGIAGVGGVNFFAETWGGLSGTGRSKSKPAYKFTNNNDQ